MRNRSLHAEGFVRADEDNVVTEQNLCLAFHNDEQMVVRVGVRGCRAAALRGWCPAELPARLEALLEKLELPIRSSWLVAELEEYLLADKKWSGSKVEVIVPEELGRCVIRPMDRQELREFMEAGCRE